MDVAYVGNYGWDEPSRVDLNQQPPVGSGWNNPTNAIPVALGGPLPGGVSPAAFCLASANDVTKGVPTPYDQCSNNAAVQTALAGNETIGSPFYKQFPYLQYIIQMGNLYHSTYNGLQITASQRVSHGLKLPCWLHLGSCP